MKLFENMNDESLIESILKGDVNAYGELYSRYYKRVFQKCQSLVKDHDEAFDLAQEALIKALNSLKGFRGQAAFSTWLYIIVHRNCLEYLRKKNKRDKISLSLNQESVMIEQPNDLLDQLEMEKIMMTLIDKLPEEEKGLLLLKYNKGESIKDLHNMFHVSESAVKMRLKRTRERLNQLYSVATNIGLAAALSQLA